MKVRLIVILSLVILSILTNYSVKADDQWLDFYGRVTLTLDQVNDENSPNYWELNSNASRIGIKGLGDAGSLEAFYQLEWQIDITDVSSNKDGHIKPRNQFVGVRGAWGEVLAGRHDTPTKKLQKKIDLFNHLTADIGHTFNGEVSASNIIQYTTPSHNGFMGKWAVIPGEGIDGNTGLADANSISLEYFKNGLSLGGSSEEDVEGESVVTNRYVIQYRVEAWQLGFLYQDTDNNGIDGEGIMASLKFTAGDNTFKFQSTESNIWQTTVKPSVQYSSQTSLGWDHKQSKNITFIHR